MIRARGTRELKARAGLGLGVIAALAIAIWAAVSRGNGDPPPTTASTTTVATTATTTSTTIASTTSTTAATTTTPAETTVDPEARVEEVRQILQDLWFRWLLALYNGDATGLTDVVATQAFLESFEGAVGTLEFTREPTEDDLDVTIHEILRDTKDCLVVHRTVDAGDLLAGDSAVVGVDVLWPHDGGWRLATGWVHPTDRWQSDCDSIREELP